MFLDKVIKGKIGENAGIPGGLPRLDSKIYNIQPGKITSTVGSPKSGKTYFMLYRYILSPWMQGVRNIKWFLFTLEVLKDQIITRMVSYFMFYRFGIRISASEIFSMGNYRISDDIHDKLKIVFEEDIEPLLDRIEIIEDASVSNPTGLNKYIHNYLAANGKFYFTDFETLGDKGEKTTKQRVSGYVKNNPNEEVFIIIDSLGLMKRENNLSKKDNIDRWIDDYAVKLRNICGCSIINLH